MSDAIYSTTIDLDPNAYTANNDADSIFQKIIKEGRNSNVFRCEYIIEIS